MKKINPEFNDVAMTAPLKGSELRDEVYEILADNKRQMPSTQRLSDVRLIVNNTSGHVLQFLNPGNHSNGVQEKIPAKGEDTAVMMMLAGATVDEQYKNARKLYEDYQLGTKGLTDKFINDLKQGKLKGLVAEAYGPAPFQAQAGRLVHATRTEKDGTQSEFAPQVGKQAAFGMRPPTEEAQFMAQFPGLRVEGDGTTVEVGDPGGINVGIGADGSTRPIAPAVAATYYGEKFDDIRAIIGFDGKVKALVLEKEGNKVLVDRHPDVQSYKPPKGPGAK